MNKLKESILSEATNSGNNASNDATKATTNATTSATNATTRSSDTYICGVGIVALLAIGACVVFANNKKSSETTKKQLKEPVGHIVRPIKPQKNVYHALAMMIKDSIYK